MIFFNRAADVISNINEITFYVKRGFIEFKTPVALKNGKYDYPYNRISIDMLQNDSMKPLDSIIKIAVEMFKISNYDAVNVNGITVTRSMR